MQTLKPCPRLPARLLEHARLLPGRDAMLPLLPKGRRWAEIGVAFGDFSQKILDICAPESFVAIDIFRIHEMQTIWGRPTAEVFGGRTHGDFYRDRFSDVIASGRMRVMEEDSAAALARLPDRSLDIAYIDADHTFDYVARELALVSRKVAADGIIILNDYIMTDVVAGHAPYGVIQAANAFMLAENWEMIFFALQDYMYCDVAIRRRGSAPTIERAAMLERENRALRAEIDALRGSTSWLMTAPLRSLSRKLRPVKRR